MAALTLAMRGENVDRAFWGLVLVVLVKACKLLIWKPFWVVFIHVWI